MKKIIQVDWENDVTDYDFIDEYSSEWEEFQGWYHEKGCGTAEEFILEKYGKGELEKRKQIILERWTENDEEE